MVDSHFRHPKFALLLVLAGVVLAFVAVAGPRDDGLVGVGDANAADGDANAADTTTSTADPGVDDGVVFTAPGELVEVVNGPTTTSGGVVDGAGSTPGTTAVAPSTTSRPASAAPPSTQRPAHSDDEAAAATPSTTEEPSRPEVTTEPPPSGVVGQNAAVGDEVASGAVAALADAPEIEGVASGAPGADTVILGQLGTRDANSTPWMLLIAANFLVAVGALTALRLRR